MRCVPLLLFLALASPALAAQPAKSYQVDVLVFENRLPQLDGGEQGVPPEQAPIPNLDEAIVGPDAPANAPLAADAAKLAQDPHYRILAHKLWVQPPLGKNQAPIMRIEDAQGELDGTFVLYKSVFLHTDLDLEFHPNGETVVYPLKDARRVRTNETNYYDHPRFGVLVRIVPVS